MESLQPRLYALSPDSKSKERKRNRRHSQDEGSDDEPNCDADGDPVEGSSAAKRHRKARESRDNVINATDSKKSISTMLLPQNTNMHASASDLDLQISKSSLSDSQEGKDGIAEVPPIDVIRMR